MSDKFTYNDIVQSLISHCEIQFTYLDQDYWITPNPNQTAWVVYKANDEASEQSYDTYQQALQEATIIGKPLEEIFRSELYTYISGVIYW